MDFDEKIDRRGTNCNKWDHMERVYGVSPDDGIAMWVADSDFRPPACVQRAVQKITDHGVYGYGGDKDAYRQAVCWWMEHRHGWRPEPEMVFATSGLVNAVGLCLHSWSDPGDRGTGYVAALSRIRAGCARRAAGVGRIAAAGRE